MIKYLILCLVSVLVNNVASLSMSQKANIQGAFLSSGLHCIKDHMLSPEDIMSLKNKRLPDKENTKCFAACLFKKIGVMDDMGKVSPSGVMEQAKKVLHSDNETLMKVEEFITLCSKVNDKMVMDGDKGCDRAKLAFECLVQNAPKFGVDADF